MLLFTFLNTDMNALLLEVCAFNIQSAIIAERVGAKRVELCDNPVEGGTTPSYGAIERTREKIAIELYPIIRPRCGNYLYDEDEWAIIQKDILLCKQLGCDGISIGIQLPSGEIDAEKMKRVVDWAYPMGVTCNRVFDATPNASKALETLIDCGCERILTSGQKSSAPEGVPLLNVLVQQAAERIIIMPGAGVRAANMEQLIAQTRAKEFHTSARKWVEDNVAHKNPDVLDIGQVLVADEIELCKIMDILQKQVVE